MIWDYVNRFVVPLFLSPYFYLCVLVVRISKETGAENISSRVHLNSRGDPNIFFIRRPQFSGDVRFKEVAGTPKDTMASLHLRDNLMA